MSFSCPLFPTAATLALAAAGLASTPALAQIDVSLNEQAFTSRATPGLPDPADDPASAFLTGDGDLLLLNDAKHLTLRSHTSWGYTNNAFLSNDNRVSDTFSRQEVALQAATRVDDTWDVFLEGGVIFTEFVDEDQLSSDTLFARTGLSTELWGGTVGSTVTGNFIREEGFGDGLIDQLVLTGFYLKPFQLSDKWVLSTRLIASQTWADPHDFTNFRFTGGADLITPLLPSVLWITGVDVFGAWYSDFFPGAGLGERADFGYRAATQLRWNVFDNTALSGVVAYNFLDSNINPLDHNELNLSLNLRVSFNF